MNLSKLTKIITVLSLVLFASNALSMSVLNCGYTHKTGSFEIDLENLVFTENGEESNVYAMGTMGNDSSHPYFYYLVPPFGTEIFLVLPRHILDSENYRFTAELDYYDEGHRELIRCVGIGL